MQMTYEQSNLPAKQINLQILSHRSWENKTKRRYRATNFS